MGVWSCAAAAHGRHAIHTAPKGNGTCGLVSQNGNQEQQRQTRMCVAVGHLSRKTRCLVNLDDDYYSASENFIRRTVFTTIKAEPRMCITKLIHLLNQYDILSLCYEVAQNWNFRNIVQKNNQSLLLHWFCVVTYSPVKGHGNRFFVFRDVTKRVSMLIQSTV